MSPDPPSVLIGAGVADSGTRSRLHRVGSAAARSAGSAFSTGAGYGRLCHASAVTAGW